MTRLILHLGLAALAGLPLFACHPTERRARTALGEARYPDALAHLYRLESRLPRRPPRWQASYALERGLAHLAVGDAQSALLWLDQAQQWHQHDPRLLTPRDQSRLATAWLSMGIMPGERPNESVTQ
jgi:hypothetical protein